LFKEFVESSLNQYNNGPVEKEKHTRVFEVELAELKNENVYKIIHNLFSEKLKLQDIDVEVAHIVWPVKKLWYCKQDKPYNM
jgi:hypothetical protein